MPTRNIAIQTIVREESLIPIAVHIVGTMKAQQRVQYSISVSSLYLAFHIVFKLSTKKKGLWSVELSHGFDLRQMTCWNLNWKYNKRVQFQAIPSYGYNPCRRVFWVGEYEEGKIGRSSESKKRLVVVALEILEKGGVGRAYAKIKNNRPRFRQRIQTILQWPHFTSSTYCYWRMEGMFTFEERLSLP